METVGTYLRTQREKAGLSLEGISAATKIRVSLLGDLESDSLDDLPGGVFLRGFVRSYLDVLHVNPDRGLELLDAQVEPEALAPCYTAAPCVQEDPSVGGRTFKLAHLLVLVVALLAMMGAYFLTSNTDMTGQTVSSAQTTDVDSGTTRSFTPLKR